jgi:antitoxin (DNA-binding transcriptional repressor) of toxin-antitoxin stability system
VGFGLEDAGAGDEEELAAGEEIVIARGKKPIAKLVPTEPAPQLEPRRPGRLKGLIHAEPDAFAPMTDDELREWGLL